MIKKMLTLLLCFLFLFFPFDVVSNQYLISSNAENTETKDIPPNVELKPKDKNDVMSEIVSFDYKDADLVTVLKGIAASYDLNIVPTQDIVGKVNVTLSNVTLAEALEALLLSRGYTYTHKGNIIFITSYPGAEGLDLINASFRLKYLTAAEAENLIGKAISSKGDIRLNTSTNSLVVTDYPQQIEKIRVLLETIDIQPIQVLIEAKIVDITSSDLEAIGVTYGATFTSQGLLKSRANTSYGHLDTIDGDITMATPSSSLTGGQFSLTSFALKNLDVTATIDALVRDQRANILASPSIATLNGKEARIIIGEKYPYKEKTQTTTGTTETTKFVDIGTALRVTPLVSPDGWITMNVHPEVSSVYSALDAGPRITTREADATIRVKDGDTIVIGGLLKKTDDRIINRVPVLGYIPILGFFFSSRSKDVINKELAVFITPRIVKTEQKAQIAGAEKREVYVNIEGTGERVIVNMLFEQAKNLESSEGIESVRKDQETRIAEAIDIYSQIGKQFPGSEKADDAIYRAGMLYYQFFRNYTMAKEMFSTIVVDYPKSPHARSSRKMLIHLNKLIGVTTLRERNK